MYFLFFWRSEFLSVRKIEIVSKKSFVFCRSEKMNEKSGSDNPEWIAR